MIMTAVEETGLSQKTMLEIKKSVKGKNYMRAKELLHQGRQSLVSEIQSKEEDIRHIDWIIYSLGRSE